ncbi:hypothetical protein BDV59DRAFT_82694 [Aspergillus ambiguus]|uniref:uncharacterized protein n=1 Tax=Aspergillus ambiguus TaxID=176160 RepID=UPI003CCD8581
MPSSIVTGTDRRGGEDLGRFSRCCKHRTGARRGRHGMDMIHGSPRSLEDRHLRCSNRNRARIRTRIKTIPFCGAWCGAAFVAVPPVHGTQQALIQ